MNQTTSIRAYAYVRLSREDKEKKGYVESSSISNQKMIISEYCKKLGIKLVEIFSDDGWSGGNFDRPDFKRMLQKLETGDVRLVITKDLSRLGRDASECSYYVDNYFPEHGISFFSIAECFDSNNINPTAPFLLAVNEYYIRECSDKIRRVLATLREKGLYCACPPYGYRKEATDKYKLIPDVVTAPVVKRIFMEAANGASSAAIAKSLNADGIIPPLKYRAFHRDKFTDEGLSRVSDTWNKTTVKRILQNKVYLGHTILGKTKKISMKSKKKIPIPSENWMIFKDTHTPIIDEALFEKVRINMGRGTKKASSQVKTRNSIFSGLVFCEKCGHALCSAGTVYKNEREKYWYLTCTNNRKDAKNPCSGGVRIKYSELMEIIRKDLNSLICLSEEELMEIAHGLIERANAKSGIASIPVQIEHIKNDINTASKAISRLYNDVAAEKITDDIFYGLLSDKEKEIKALKKELENLESIDKEKEIKSGFEKFHAEAKKYSHIEELDRDILTTFVKRIEVSEKVLPEGVRMVTHPGQSFTQKIKIHYNFIGNLQASEPEIQETGIKM